MASVSGCGHVHPLSMVHAPAFPAGRHQRTLCPGEAFRQGVVRCPHAQAAGSRHDRSVRLPVDGGLFQYRRGRKRSSGRRDGIRPSDHVGHQWHGPALVHTGSVAILAGPSDHPSPGQEKPLPRLVRKGVWRQGRYSLDHPSGHTLLGRRAADYKESQAGKRGRAV